MQGQGDAQSAGYQGYWGTNFPDVDPHLGTREDYKAFVDAAHARNLKVYFDIVTNHTADVIRFRIDTARHVNSEFWQAFIPAMLEKAKARGIENFHIFGEVMEFDPGVLARFTHVERLPAVNDFTVQRAITEVVAKGAPTEQLARVFAADPLYRGGEATARKLVTLVGNHDVLRLGRTLLAENPNADQDELLRRAILAYAILLHARGVSALYYGDEGGGSQAKARVTRIRARTCFRAKSPATTTIA